MLTSVQETNQNSKRTEAPKPERIINRKLFLNNVVPWLFRISYNQNNRSQFAGNEKRIALYALNTVKQTLNLKNHVCMGEGCRREEPDGNKNSRMILWKEMRFKLFRLWLAFLG